MLKALRYQSISSSARPIPYLDLNFACVYVYVVFSGMKLEFINRWMNSTQVDGMDGRV